MALKNKKSREKESSPFSMGKEVAFNSSNDSNYSKMSFKQYFEIQASILSAIPHAVIGLKERTIFFANESVKNVFGWNPDELIGQKTRLLYRSDKEYEEIGNHFYPLLEKQRTHIEEFPCIRKDGQEIICRISASVIGKEMMEKSIVVMYEDITEQKKTQEKLNKYQEHLEKLVKERTEHLEKLNMEFELANERLKELDRLKSIFIASISHELRTPLNSIIGFTGMTLQGLSGPINDEQKDNLKRVYQSAKHLLSLISDIIDISKIEAGKIDSSIEEVSLKGIIDEAIATIEPQLKEKHLGLKVNLSENIILNTDRKRLLQCLLNFLSNGVKFTEKGSITISAQKLNNE